MKEIETKWQALTLADFKHCKEAAYRAEDFLKNSPEVNHGRYLHELAIPKIYDETDIRRFEKIVETSDRIMTKITEAYLADPAYRALFPFSRELNELILTSRLYPQMIPMARYDIFYNEDTGDFKFCEINTDGTSAMNEDAICYETLPMNPVFDIIRREYRLEPFELYDSWVKAFLDTYNTYEKKVGHPYIAIVDFLEEACLNEFHIFAEHFRKAGYDTEICEIRDLTYENGRLLSPTGHPIDAVYRRAVTGDIERHWEETQAFRNAVYDQNVCVIGAFCTQIAHHKIIFKILWMEESLSYLTKEEQAFVKEHVPMTCALNREITERFDILSNKDQWIIKPYDSYGSRGVCAGVDVTREEWKALLPKHYDDDFIVQEYCTPYASENCYLPDEDAFKPYNNMPGLFAYNGKLAGIYSRLSDGGIISSQTNKRVTTTLKLLS